MLAQSVLMVLILAACARLSHPHAPVARAIGGAMVVAGLALSVWAARTMGRSFTALPTPRPDGELVTSGPYRAVRHPVYSALLLALSGACIALAPVALTGVVALATLWWCKAGVEERHLRSRFPAYAPYAARVRARIIPWVL